MVEWADGGPKLHASWVRIKAYIYILYMFFFQRQSAYYLAHRKMDSDFISVISTFVSLSGVKNLRYCIIWGDLGLSGSEIRKSRFIFTKEQRTIRQKSGCLNHLNQQIFQVNIQMQGWINLMEWGFISIMVWGFPLLILSHKYPMKMK